MAVNPHSNAPLRPIPVSIDGEEIVAYPKRFKTGTEGWHATRKINVDGREVQVNILMYLPDTVASKKTEQLSTTPETRLESSQIDEAPKKAKRRT